MVEQCNDDENSRIMTARDTLACPINSSMSFSAAVLGKNYVSESGRSYQLSKHVKSQLEV